MSDKIKFFALGGLDENGKNMFAIEINDDIFILDCGMKYPDKRIPGVDVIIPNTEYLKENKHRVKAYLMTHGHDDQMGALPYIYKDIPAPICCSTVTMKMISYTTKEYGLSDIKYNFITIDDKEFVQIGGREVQFLKVTHSIPGAYAIAISTDQGYLVYTSDFIVDFGASLLHRMDIAKFAKLGDKGTLMLLTESGDADKQGHTSPKHRITPHLESLFTESPGRIFISLYSQNVYNLQEVIDLSVKSNKKIIFYNKNTLNLLNDITVDGYHIPKQNLASIQDIQRLREQDVVVIITSVGEKIFHHLIELGVGDSKEKKIDFNENDTFVLACPPVPGTETIAIEAIDEVYKTGVRVINLSRKDIFSMHAREEDIKMMVSLLRPKFYIPVKGEFRNLMCNAKIALGLNLGYNHSNIFIFDNGMVLTVEDGKAKPDFVNMIKTGDIMVDGTDVGNIKTSVIQERQKMASDGVIILGATVSSKKGIVLTGNDIQMRGFIFLKDQEHVVKEIANIFTSQVEAYLTGFYQNSDDITRLIQEKILRYVRRETGKNPLIVPQIIDIDK